MLRVVSLLLTLFFPVVVYAKSMDLDAWQANFRKADLSRSAAKGLENVMNKPALTTTNNHDLGGSEVNPFLQIDGNCMGEAIASRTMVVGRERAEADIARWERKLANNEMTEMEFWSEILQCQEFCAQIFAESISCYTDAGAKRIKGVILFDTGVGHYQATTNGDRASYGQQAQNHEVLNGVLNALYHNPRQHVLLEGRASQVGNDEVNFRLSGHRAQSIKEELVRRNIAPSRIHWRWIGEGLPRYDSWLSDKYGLSSKHRRFGNQTMNQSVTMYVYTPER